MTLDADPFDVALRSTPPCERYACGAMTLCATHELACTAFAYYVETGRSLSPFWLIPTRVTATQPMVMRDRPEPSHSIYINIMLDEGPR